MDPVSCLRYAQSGRNIASITGHGELRWHDGYSGAVLQSRRVSQGQGWSVDVDLRHRLVGVGTGIPIFQVRLFRLPELEPWAHVSGFDGCVYDVQFSPDGTALAACEAGPPGKKIGLVPLNEIWTGEKPDAGGTDLPAITIVNKPGAEITMKDVFDTMKSHRVTHSGDESGTLDLAERVQWLGEHDHNIHSVAWSPDARLIVSGEMDGTAVVWDSILRRAKWKWKAHKAAVNSARFDPRGQSVLLASDDGTVSHWLIKDDGPALREGIRLTVRAVNSLAVSPDGDYVAFGTQDGYLVVWDLVQWSEVMKANLGNEVTSVDFCPTNDKIACGDSSGTVHVLELRNVQTHSPALTAVFGDDGLFLDCPYCWESAGDNWRSLVADGLDFGEQNPCPGGCGRHVFINYRPAVPYDTATSVERDAHTMFAILAILTESLLEAVDISSEPSDEDLQVYLKYLTKLLDVTSLNQQERQAITQTISRFAAPMPNRKGDHAHHDWASQIDLLAQRLREGALVRSYRLLNQMVAVQQLLEWPANAKLKPTLVATLRLLREDHALSGIDPRLARCIRRLREMVQHDQATEDDLVRMRSTVVHFWRLMLACTPF